MRKISTLIISSIFSILLLQSNSYAKDIEVITPYLEEQLSISKDNDLIKINIVFKDQYNSRQLMVDVMFKDKKDRRDHVISTLKSFSETAQKDVLDDLRSLEKSKKVKNVEALWIANVINCFATPEVILELSNHPDIASVDFDEERIVIDPRGTKEATSVKGSAGTKEITWNVGKIKADDVWSLGYTGAGVVVAVIDTGVNYDHDDLNDHVWESDTYPNHGYDFYNEDFDPMDDHGHGTHCAGTVAGDGTAGSQTGMAPDATIMCLKVGGSEGGAYESDLWTAIQFSIDNDADLISMSMGWLHDWGPDREVWRQSMDNVLAAGMVASVAAGNEGADLSDYPVPDNVRTPGDCPPPWLNPDQLLSGGTSAVICVGSTNYYDEMSGFSGRGPSEWENVDSYNDYAYGITMGLIRPDIVAPGSGIKSLAHYSNSGYEDGWNGTSMACPANAGMIALMLEKNGLLTPAQISQIVEETADELEEGKNNDSGSGRINALEAIEATPHPGPNYNAHVLNDEAGNGDGIISPEENILLTVAISNLSLEDADSLTVLITSESEYISMTDSLEFYGDLLMEDTIFVDEAFAFDVANNVPGGEEIEFDVIIFNDTNTWVSSFKEIAHGIKIEIGSFGVSDPEGNNNGRLDPGETVDILIETLNTGQMEAEDLLAYLSVDDDLIVINENTFEVDLIEAGSGEIATFSISVSEEAMPGTVVNFNYEITTGNYSFDNSFFQKIGLIVEDFESGDFDEYEWGFDGNQPWNIVTSGVYSGSYCSKSGAIGNNSSSEMIMTLDVAQDDSIAFMRKVSSEADYDYLRFYIDGQLKDEWEGEEDWARVAFPVSDGEHIFKWAYVKDQYVEDGSDCGWIDNIELPAIVDVVTNLDQSENLGLFTISPNPNKGTFNVDFADERNSFSNIKIIDLTGKVVFELNSEIQSQIFMQPDNIDNGIYFLVIERNNIKRIEKLIVRK